MNALEKLVAEGFMLRSLPAYPRHLRVEKHDCAALLEMTPEGRLKQFSAAGHLVDGQIALLVERGVRNDPANTGSFRVFAYKGKEVPAEGEAMENFRRFERELRAVLVGQ